VSEKKLWTNLKRISDDTTNLFEFERVENSAGTSMADVYGTYYGIGALWIENKWVNNIGNKIKFQDGQPKWLKNQYRRGVPSFVLVGSENGYVAVYSGEDFYDMRTGIVNQEFTLPLVVHSRSVHGYNIIIDEILSQL